MGSGRCDLDGDGNVDVDDVLEVSWNPQGCMAPSIRELAQLAA